MGKKDKHTPKPKQRLHLLGDGLVVLANVGLLSEGNDNYGGDSPLTKAGYALDAADEGNWSDPNDGAFANVDMALHAAAENIVSVDGAIIEAGAFGIRHILKHSSWARKTITSSKHHRLVLG